MNHREPPHRAIGGRLALRCLPLLLLPAFAPRILYSHSQPGNRGSVPYLPHLGGPPLRFQAAPPSPDPAARPSAAAPPIPPLTPTESVVAQANAAAVQSVITHPPAPAPAPAPPAAEPPAAKPAPPALLPDDTRQPIRPEDFLPYFQFPATRGSPGAASVIVPGVYTAPAPSPLPPSSATYIQSPQ